MNEDGILSSEELNWGTYDWTIDEVDDDEEEGEEVDALLGKLLKYCHKERNLRSSELLSLYEEYEDLNVIEDLNLRDEEMPEAEKCVSEMSSEEAPFLTFQLSEAVQVMTGYLNQEDPSAAIKFVRRLTEEELKSVVRELWIRASDSETRGSLVKSLCCSREAVKALCSEALLPWSLQDDQWEAALSTVLAASSWLDSSLIHDILVPLAVSSPLSTTEGIIDRLSPEQCSELLPALALQPSIPLSLMTLVAERISSLSTEALGVLISFVSPLIPSKESDRYMGRFLLAIASQLRVGSHPQDLLNQTVSICQSFKGVMRFRIVKVIAALEASQT